VRDSSRGQAALTIGFNARQLDHTRLLPREEALPIPKADTMSRVTGLSRSSSRMVLTGLTMFLESQGYENLIREDVLIEHL